MLVGRPVTSRRRNGPIWFLTMLRSEPLDGASDWPLPLDAEDEPPPSSAITRMMPPTTTMPRQPAMPQPPRILAPEPELCCAWAGGGGAYGIPPGGGPPNGAPPGGGPPNCPPP